MDNLLAKSDNAVSAMPFFVCDNVLFVTTSYVKIISKIKNLSTVNLKINKIFFCITVDALSIGYYKLTFTGNMVKYKITV